MTDFRNVGVAGLAKLNDLSVDGNCELFSSRDTTRILTLILEGMAKILEA